MSQTRMEGMACPCAREASADDDDDDDDGLYFECRRMKLDNNSLPLRFFF